jgi:hypothetical protein
MANIPDNTEFTVDEWGDTTAEHLQGKFDLKLVLTHKEQLARDELRRLYIGSFNSATPSPRASNQAELFAEINIRIRGDKGAPSWWKDAEMGLLLKDDNIVMSINTKLNDALKDRDEKVKKAIAEARGDVKTLNAQP